MILRDLSKKVKVLITSLVFLIGLIIFLRWYNSETVTHRGKYNEVFSFNIHATCNDMGRVIDIGHNDSPWERKISIIKNNKDSLEFTLSTSKYIGFLISNDTIIINGNPHQLLVFGNIGDGFELAVDVDTMKIIDNRIFWDRIRSRQKYNLENNVFPKDYLRLHSNIEEW